jgi:hypothetical protein
LGQVHVAHRGAEVGVSRQLLNGPNRRAEHREVRAEGVALDVAFVSGTRRSRSGRARGPGGSAACGSAE